MSQLIEEHLSYARGIAGDMLKRLPPTVDRADVESAAYLGLVQAANSWDASRGVSFITFAYYRIRGAIYDGLRQTARQNKFEQAANDYMIDQTAAPHGDGPANDYAELKNTASTLITAFVISLETLPHDPADGNSKSPADQVLANERSQMVRKEVAHLPAKNRAVMQGYYFDGLSLEEVGARLGLSKSWVCRVHAKSLEMLKDRLSVFSPRPAIALREKMQPTPRPQETAPTALPITV